MERTPDASSSLCVHAKKMTNFSSRQTVCKLFADSAAHVRSPIHTYAHLVYELFGLHQCTGLYVCQGTLYRVSFLSRNPDFERAIRTVYLRVGNYVSRQGNTGRIPIQRGMRRTVQGSMVSVEHECIRVS